MVALTVVLSSAFGVNLYLDLTCDFNFDFTSSHTRATLPINGRDHMAGATQSLLKPTLHMEVCLKTASASSEVRKDVSDCLATRRIDRSPLLTTERYLELSRHACPKSSQSAHSDVSQRQTISIMPSSLRGLKSPTTLDQRSAPVSMTLRRFSST